MKLRDYQQKAVDSVLAAWKDHRSCVVVLPTGCGKTVVFAEVIKQRLTADGSAMILAHREELIRQAADKVSSITGQDTQIEMGPMKVTPMFGKMPPVVVSTVQTQITGRIKNFNPSEFTTLVIDEAHHATSSSYRQCIDHYFQNPGCRLLGVTATPDRADETALGNVFETVAFEYSVTDAIRDGWLVPVKQKLVKVGSLDFSGISTTAGDLNQGELAEVLEDEQNLHSVAVPTLEICGNRRAIIFAASVKQAERLAEILNRGTPSYPPADRPLCDSKGAMRGARNTKTGGAANLASEIESAGSSNGSAPDGATIDVPTDSSFGSPRANGHESGASAPTQGDTKAEVTQDRAAWLCGKTDKGDRAQILKDFREGKIQFVVNVGVLTEGFDDAGVEVVVMARPTKSRALYAQMAGRATRPAAEVAGKLGTLDAEARRKLIAESSKPSCLIIDFVGNSGRHKLVTTADILGGKDLDEDAEIAAEVKRRCTGSAEGLDMLEEIEKVKEEIKQRRFRDAQSRKFITATAKFTTFSVDPFDVFDLAASVRHPKSGIDTYRLSFKQRALLRERIKVNPDSISPSEGKALIDEYFRRVTNKLATFAQTKLLRRHGIPVPMSFDEASRTISRLMGR